MRGWVVVILVLVASVPVMAQTAGSDSAAQVLPPKVQQYRKPVFRGVSVVVDAASPLMGIAYGDVVNVEAQVGVNLYRRLYPVFEVGFASVRKVSTEEAVYSSHSPFFRVGLDFGLLKPFKDDGSWRSVRSYPFVGVRYAFSPMNYRIDNVVVRDEYWGTESVVDYGRSAVYSGWIEVVGGVRVDLYKGLTMGWSVRLKALLHTSAPSKNYLWYVPGYGRVGDVGFGFNYTIGYTFHYGEDKESGVKH